MKHLRHIALLALFTVYPLASTASGATMLDSLLFRFKTYSTLCSPEKVYLHFDRSCYTAGETIWFKGWVQEASLFSNLPPSNFIYAEVLDSRGEAMARVKVKRTGDGFPGCIELPDDLETGDYTIRAYSLWQLNNHIEYLFNDTIRIIGGKGKKEKKPGTQQSGVELSFWPEGGRYFDGHKAVIGFKAVDRQGRSVDFNGFLVRGRDSVERRVFTVHDGMGTFAFLPQPGQSYGIRDESGRIHPLPSPSEEGATLQLRIHSGRYYIAAIGFGGGEASLLVRDLSELRPLAQVSLDGKPGVFIMEKSFFRPGINHFLLVDSRGKILSERLFYVRDDNAPICRLDMDRFTDTPRSKVQGSISLNSPGGAPLDGTCSVSVVRGSLKDWQQSDGITSYMGLGSELKGRIHNPCYYFDPDIPIKERDAALDLLMMIQGWRYYDMEKITDVKGGFFRIRHVREMMQEIRGRITRRISSKAPRNFIFTVLIPKLNMVHSMEVEQGSDFIIDSLDFQENTGVLINIGTSRLGATYLPKWDGDPAAEPYVYKLSPGFAGAVKPEAPRLDEAASDDTLKAAVVTASYQDKDVLIFGHSYRQDLVTYKDMTLVEYLSMTKAMFEYDGENMYNRTRRRNISYSEDSQDGIQELPEPDEFNQTGQVKLIVDDLEEPWWGYDMLRLEDLRSLSISTQPDPFYGGDGGVVHISVKPGGLSRSTNRDPSLLYFVPLGYQVPRYFESPRYDRGDYVLSDKRNTVWWSPDVRISGGRAAISFFNSDLTDFPYIVRIEGIGADGRPFSSHCMISPE